MRKLKRLYAIILTLVLLTTVSLTTMAANNALVDTTAAVSLTIHKYQMDKQTMDALTNYADGTVKTVTALPLAGVTFTINQVKIKAGATAGSTNTADYDKVSPVVTATAVTDSNGVIKFTTDGDGKTGTALPQGIYLVQEKNTGAITAKSADFLVSLPMTNPTRNGWLYDVHAYPKNVVEAGPDIDKSVTQLGNQHDGANLWEDVTWIITTEIPLGIADSKEYKVTDQLHKILKYKIGSLELSFTSASTGSKRTLTAGTHYTLTHTPTVYPNQETLAIELNAAGRLLLADALGTNPNATNLPRLTLSFKTYFDRANIPAADLKNYIGIDIQNKAKLDYTNSIGMKYSPESEIPEVHTGGIRLKKVNASDTTKTLPGARFKIYPSKTDAEQGTNALKDPNNSAQEWVVTTLADGIAEWMGLAYGGIGVANSSASRDYWIVEIEAPAGFNLLTAPERVTVNGTSHLTANEIIVKNNAGFRLPLTGDAGALLFTLGGLVLIGTAGIVLFLSIRKKSKKSKEV